MGKHCPGALGSARIGDGTSISRAPLERIHVALSPHGSDEAGVVHVSLKLLSEPVDVNLEQVLGFLLWDAYSHNVLHDLTAREYGPRTLREHAEHVEFSAGQRDLVLIDGDPPLLEVDPKISKLDDAARRPIHTKSTQRRMKLRSQPIGIEGAGDVICSPLEECHRILHRHTGSDDEYEAPTHGLRGADEVLQNSDVGSAREYRGVRLRIPHCVQQFLRSLDRVDLKAPRAQQGVQLRTFARRTAVDHEPFLETQYLIAARHDCEW